MNQQNPGFDSHISERYNKNLLGVFHKLLAMGGVVEEQLLQVQHHLSDIKKRVDSEQIKTTERQINDMDLSVNEDVVHIIATHQPIANDLRLLVASVKIATDLERIGDEISSCFKSIQRYDDDDVAVDNFSYDDLANVLSRLIDMLQRALNAFARLDSEEAHQVMKSDRKVDKEYTNLTRIVLTYIMEKPSKVTMYVDVANVLRSLERIGDHITNIAEHLVFIITGTDVRYMSTKDIGKLIRD